MATTQVLFLLLKQPSEVEVSSFIPSGETFYTAELNHSGVVTTSGVIDTSALYQPNIITQQVVGVSTLDEGLFYSVYVNPIQVDAIVSGEGFYSASIDSEANIGVAPIDSEESFYSSSVTPGGTDVTLASYIDDVSFYSIGLSFEVTPIEVTGVIDESVFYISEIVLPTGVPLSFRLPSGLGGKITSNEIAPALRYYDIPQSVELSEDLLRHSQVNNLVPSYLPSTDALFRKTIYRGFYVYNPSTLGITNGTARNVTFWINGGETLRMDNAATPGGIEVYEGSKYLSATDSDEYRLEGNIRTSMFGQVDIQAYVSPVRDLKTFDENGKGGSFDLSKQPFTPAQNRMYLPDLAPGEYVGIYLRIDTKFNPNLNKMSDYSFFHVSYNNLNNGVRETYPGQLRTIPPETVDLRRNVLPSVVLKVTTNYTKLNTYMDTIVDDLYRNYPPFFAAYEES